MTVHHSLTVVTQGGEMDELANSNHASDDKRSLLDYVGIGFGPSNLALAVAATERPRPLSGLFFESQPSFRWHPGMMLEGARMQISYLKDLATLRNPASPHSFLQYLKQKGRLERFVNLYEFFPTRVEYQDYLSWVADAFVHQVRYGTRVRKVSAVLDGQSSRIAAFRVHVDDPSGGSSVYFAKNLIYSPGGSPNIEKEMGSSPLIIHTSNFLLRFPAKFPDRQSAYTFLVAGDGQSAAEVVKYLCDYYPNSKIYLVMSGYGLRPADCTPFVNEVFCAKEVDWFYGLSKESRTRVIRQLRNTNYGVVDGDLIMALYRSSYQDEVTGTQRLFVLRFSRLITATQRDSKVEAVVRDLCAETTTALNCDAVVLATGYRRDLDKAIFADLLPFLSYDRDGDLMISRQYRAHLNAETEGGLYLQGLTESSHGLGDTLLSLLPFRSEEILDDICKIADRQVQSEKPKHRPAATTEAAGEYPPKRHLEPDQEKIYAVLERFPFATLVSAEKDHSLITHAPLTLDRSRGRHGVLFGHMDKFNPHVELLDDRPIIAIFHGPNSYISPHVYETDQLPTWNSITVHALGRVHRLKSQSELIRGLIGISEYSDRRPGAYRLPEDDPRIGRLIEFIVGFEIEIEKLIGRFKLSQDRVPRDQELAKEALIRRTEEGERLLIEAILPGGNKAKPGVVMAMGQD